MFTAHNFLREFARGGSSCAFSAEYSMMKGGKEVLRRLEFAAGEAVDGGIALRWEVMQAGEGAIRLRLRARNIGSVPVYIGKLTPLVIAGGDLKLGEHDSSDWVFYRQGRHKNDLPSVCCLGKDDASFADALSSLLETGGMGEDAGGLSLISDNLTVIKGSPSGDENMVISFVTGADFMLECVLNLDDDRRFAGLRASSCCNVRLDPGKEIESEVVEVAFVSDVFGKIESFAREKAELYNARKSRIFAGPPSVYCTWYYYGTTVTEADVRENLDELVRRRIPFDVYQIDDGWEIVRGDWRVNEKFPSGMKAVAEEIRAKGFVPGIWTSPFIAHETAPVVKEHPDWFLYHHDGSPCIFPMSRIDYMVLDVTNPEAVAWAGELYATLRQWGYMYHKLDFTRAAVIQTDCKYHDGSVSITKAYRDAVAVIRENMGDDAYFLMCGGLYDPLIGIVDGQRSGSDTLSMWSLMRKEGGKAAPFTIKQSLLRYWMNPWWDNDPDALMVRRRGEMERGLQLTLGLLNEDEVETSVLNQYLGGGLVCSTEPMAQIDDDRLFTLRHIMPVVDIKPVPRDMFAASRYPAVVDAAVNGGDWHTVAFINWSDDEAKPCEFVIDSDLLGEFAREHVAFIVSTFDGEAVIENAVYGQKIRLRDIPPHGSLLVKIAPQSSLPAVIGSSNHFSMGGELGRLAIDNMELVFDVKYGFDYPVRYIVRLPEGYHTTRLPGNVSARGRDVVINLPTRGDYRVSVPLARG